MRPSLRILSILFLSICGCNDSSDEDNENQYQQQVEAQKQKNLAISQEIRNDPSAFSKYFYVESGEGDNGSPSSAFLWKPTSDSNGKLVVLLPAQYKNVSSISIHGSSSESASRGSIGNGSRPHFRFSHPGSYYGSNIRVVAGNRYWIVPNGSARTQL